MTDEPCREVIATEHGVTRCTETGPHTSHVFIGAFTPEGENYTIEFLYGWES
jgi:hypothetical protein